MDENKILHQKDYVLKEDDKFRVSQAPHILKDDVELCETSKTSCRASYTSQNEQFVEDVLKDMEDIKDILTFYANSTIGEEISPGIYQTELKNGNQCLYNAIMARKALNKSLNVILSLRNEANKLKSLTNDKE